MSAKYKSFILISVLAVLILVVSIGAVAYPGESVTGGGWIIKGGEKANFGFNVKYQNNGKLQGNLEFEDRSTGQPVQYKATDLSKLIVSKNKKFAGFTGKLEIDREGSYDFRVHVTDNGSPGTSDIFSIQVSNGYSASGVLGGGNIDIKK